jgi:hypothetical protein
MSVVTALSARTPSSAPGYELHIATEEARVVDGLNEDETHQTDLSPLLLPR